MKKKKSYANKLILSVFPISKRVRLVIIVIRNWITLHLNLDGVNLFTINLDWPQIQDDTSVMKH